MIDTQEQGQPSGEPEAKAADPAAEAITSAPAAPIVGDTVRLASGEAVTVHGVRRGPAGIAIMRAGGEWLDASDAEIIAQD